MPLTDLVRYFNAADSAEDSMLYLDGERAAAWHKGCGWVRCSSRSSICGRNAWSGTRQRSVPGVRMARR